MLPPTAAAASPAKPPAVETTLETVGARASETLLSTQAVAMSFNLLSCPTTLVYALPDLLALLDYLTPLAADFDFAAVGFFSLGGDFFGAAPAGLDSGDGFSESVTSVILGFSLLSERFWDRVELIEGRNAGLGAELDGKGFGFGGSLGIVLPFHAGLAFGAP